MPAESTNDQSRRATIALYTLWILFCSLLIFIGVWDQHRNPDVRWWEPLLWEGSSMAVATLWFVHRRRNTWRYRRYLDQPFNWLGHQLKWLPLMAIAFVVTVYSIRHGVYALAGITYRHEPWATVFIYETLKLTLFMALWSGAIFGFDSFAQWQAQREALLAAQKALAEAQLSQLKAQLRPHFLFNALNTISSLMHTNVEQADSLLARLGDLLRASLQFDDRQLVRLDEELRLLTLYAQIMQQRFSDRVTLQWNIDPRAIAASLPALLLQPLLENAFKHGVERSGRAEAITITAKRVDDRLQIIVHNTGSQLPSSLSSSTLSNVRNDGIGIRNSRERLRVLYGDQARLELTENASGVQASLDIPYAELAEKERAT